MSLWEKARWGCCRKALGPGGSWAHPLALLTLQCPAAKPYWWHVVGSRPGRHLSAQRAQLRAGVWIVVRAAGTFARRSLWGRVNRATSAGGRRLKKNVLPAQRSLSRFQDGPGLAAEALRVSNVASGCCAGIGGRRPHPTGVQQRPTGAGRGVTQVSPMPSQATRRGT